MRPSRSYLWWALLVLPLWLVLALCAHWEPVMNDGWGHFAWHRAHVNTPAELYGIGVDIYRYQNPRLGQLATLLAYTPGPYHAIVTPLVELGVLALLTALALGRWPSVRRSDDAFAGLVVSALFVACVPQIGPMLGYRPYTSNYVLGLAINLAWLVPYRFALEAPVRRRGLAPVMLVAGFAAGLCNEHTGLAFFALGAALAVSAWRRAALRVWMIAGLIGLAAGYVALLTAPGQAVRYSGLANDAGLVDRVAARGVLGSLEVIGQLALALVPALPLAIAGLVARRAYGPTRRGWIDAGLALAGVACTLTLLASPKLGPRLFAASVALVIAGLVGGLVVDLRGRLRLGCALACAAALIFVEVRLIAVYRVIGPLGATRLERLERAAPGSVVRVPRYPVPASRYFLGEDLTAKHDAIAEIFHLAGVVEEP